MKVHARARYIRQSPYKVRRILDMVRGLPVADARHLLGLSDRRAADPIVKVLESAVANAMENHRIPEDELVVAEAFANEGPTLKRFQPRARGRASRILKRTSHITIAVADREGS